MVHIYALKHKEEIFYIGKTKNIKTRISGHKLRSILLLDDKDKKIQEIIQSGSELEFIILDSCEEIEGIFLEAKYIKEYSVNYELLNICHNTYRNLSELERVVLIMMSEDKDTKEMATQLFRSHRTIETVRLHLKEKAKVKTLSGLIMWAIKNGFITI